MSTMTATAEEKLAAVGRKLIDKVALAAKLGGVSVKTVDRMEIPGKVTLGGRLVRFDERLVDEWIARGCPAAR